MTKNKITYYVLASVAMFVLLVYRFPLFLQLALEFSKKTYDSAGYLGYSGIDYLGFLAISIFSAYWNYKIFKSINAQNTLTLFAFLMVDLLMVLISIIVIVLFKNYKSGVPSTKDLIDPFVFAFLISLKNVFILLVRGKLIASRKKS